MWLDSDSTNMTLVKRYEIDSLTEVYSFPSCYGNGHMLDPTILTYLGISNILISL